MKIPRLLKRDVAVVLSLLVHIGIWTSIGQREASPIVIAPKYIVELLPASKKKSVKKSKPASEVAIKKVKPKVWSTSDFKLTPYTQEKTNNYISPSSFFREESPGNAPDVLDTVNNLELKELGENHLFFSKIVQRIDREIQYPDVFAKQWHQGHVSLIFVVNHKGQLETIRASRSQNALLQAYSTVSVYNALSSPLPKKAWNKNRKYLTFRVDFDYELILLGHPQLPNQISSYKNTIQLTRYREVESEIAYKVRRFQEKYLPIYPGIGGGVVINFGAIYNTILEWNQLDEDTLRREKISLTRDQLEQELKKILK